VYGSNGSFDVNGSSSADGVDRNSPAAVELCRRRFNDPFPMEELNRSPARLSRRDRLAIGVFDLHAARDGQAPLPTGGLSDMRRSVA
jgi:hypothetical protein